MNVRRRSQIGKKRVRVPSDVLAGLKEDTSSGLIERVASGESPQEVVQEIRARFRTGRIPHSAVYGKKKPPPPEPGKVRWDPIYKKLSLRYLAGFSHHDDREFALSKKREMVERTMVVHPKKGKKIAYFVYQMPPYDDWRFSPDLSEDHIVKKMAKKAAGEWRFSVLDAPGDGHLPVRLVRDEAHWYDDESGAKGEVMDNIRSDKMVPFREGSE